MPGLMRTTVRQLVGAHSVVAGIRHDDVIASLPCDAVGAGIALKGDSLFLAKRWNGGVSST